MKIMIERFIRANIVNLNYHLTMGFLETKSIFPTEDEAIVITNFLKENYQEIVRGNHTKLLLLKGSVREDIYQAVTKLFIELKNQYL